MGGCRWQISRKISALFILTQAVGGVQSFQKTNAWIHQSV
jgi:hypothetical protein